MLDKKKKTLLVLIMLALILMSYTPICYANSLPPPLYVIIVPNAPYDLELSIETDDEIVKADRSYKLFESYFVFRSWNLPYSDYYTIKVTTEKTSFEVTVERPPSSSYENIYTLDLKNQTIIQGKSLSRSIILVSMRIILTLSIEGLVFYLFGYRQKRSWITFLVINMLTQVSLNVLIDNFSPILGYYALIIIVAEFIIFMIEAIVYLSVIKERNSFITFLYAFVANFMSLFLGGLVFIIMPI